MSLPELAIQKRAVTYFVSALLLFGGVGSFFSLGWLEDPEFTVKTATGITAYPGASHEEVEQEVKQAIEDAGKGGGYIISSSNTIHPGCKPENYIAMVKAAHKYGVY